MLRRLFIVCAAVGGSAAVSGCVAARTIWRTWGRNADEAAMPLPGDDLVAGAESVDTRGIDIAASPAEVWPWLVQMGYGRAGWYSYDQLDMSHPSANRILPEFQSLAVGDILPTDPGGGFEVRVLDPGRALVLYVDRSLVEAQRKRGADEAKAAEGLDAAPPNVWATGAYLDRTMSGEFAASWAFVLERRDVGVRLIERVRVNVEPPVASAGRSTSLPGVARSLLGFGVFAMVRRQMLGIRDRAEGRPVRPGWMRAERLAGRGIA